MKKVLISILVAFSISYSLTLEEAQEKALNKNLQIKQKYLDYQIAQQRLNQNKQLWYPKVFFNAEYTSFKDTIYTNIPLGLVPFQNLKFKQFDKDFLQVKAGLAYPVFTGFIRPNKIKISKLEVQNKKLLTGEQKQEVLEKVSLAYIDALIADELIKVYKEEEKALQNLKFRAEKFLKQGLITKVDLLQVKVQLQKVRYKEEKAKENAKNARLMLSYLIGEPINDDVKLEPIKNFFIPQKLPVKKLEEEALNKREILKVIKNKAKQSDYAYRIAKGQFLPKVYVQGGYSYTDENPYITPKDNLFIAVGSTLQFQGVKPYYQMLEAKLLKSKSLLKLQDVKRGLKLKLYSLYNQFLSLKTQLTLAKTELKEAFTYYQMAKKQYNSQLISMTDLLIAHSKYFAAKSKEKIVKYQLLKTFFKIKRVVGGLKLEK